MKKIANFICLSIFSILSLFFLENSSIIYATPLIGPKPITPEEFRSLFLRNLSVSQKRNLDYYIYLPTAQIKDPTSLTTDDSAESWMQRVEDIYKSTSPYQLFVQGWETPLAEMPKHLSQGPTTITFVVIPGIFGELIDDAPFGELFEAPAKEKSSFYQTWKQNFQKTTKAELKTDLQGSLAATNYPASSVAKIPVSLDSLIHVSGIDSDSRDHNNNGVNIQIIDFKLPLFSLESVGDQYVMSDVYIRRLNKIFSILPKTPENIVFIGYSRGGAIVLDIIEKATKKQQQLGAWAKHIRGVVTLGGVIYGTELADVGMGYKKPQTKKSQNTANQLNLIKQLAHDLEYKNGKGFIYEQVIFVKNIYRYLKTGKNFISIILNGNGEKKEEKEGQEGQEAGQDESNYNAYFQMNPLFPLHLAYTFAFKALGLQEPLDQYDHNIQKFKILIDEVFYAISQISVKSRLEWWKRSQLPNNGVRYYAITGTMVDPALDKSPTSTPLIKNPYCYAPETADDQFLAGAYLDFASETGFFINDSQMDLQRSQFWNEYNALLSPYYIEHPLKTSLLTVLGTHHWGFALRSALKMKDKQENPFPKITLLKTVAESIAIDLKNGQITTE